MPSSYDQAYAKKGFYWGLKPHDLVVKAAKHLPPHAKTLDLGCGEGKDSFSLARKGFRVTAIDSSAVGVKKLERLAEKEKLAIETEIGDLRERLKSRERFDAILCINALQFLERDDIPQAIKRMQARTRTDGINVIASFIAENDEQKASAVSRGRYLFAAGELKERYKGWTIILYEEKRGPWETHGEPRHRHFKVWLIARKH